MKSGECAPNRNWTLARRRQEDEGERASVREIVAGGWRAFGHKYEALVNLAEERKCAVAARGSLSRAGSLGATGSPASVCVCLSVCACVLGGGTWPAEILGLQFSPPPSCIEREGERERAKKPDAFTHKGASPPCKTGMS